MYAFGFTVLTLGALLTSANGAGRAEEVSAPRPPGDAAPAIAVKQTDRITAVFLEHTGAYWTVGPVLTRDRSLT